MNDTLDEVFQANNESSNNNSGWKCTTSRYPQYSINIQVFFNASTVPLFFVSPNNSVLIVRFYGPNFAGNEVPLRGIQKRNVLNLCNNNSTNLANKTFKQCLKKTLSLIHGCFGNKKLYPKNYLASRSSQLSLVIKKIYSLPSSACDIP